MTFQRVLNRNHLQDGDYGRPPTAWHHLGMTAEINQGLAMLAGDLRRLEQDAVNEKAVCVYIAQRTGVDQSTVAVGLKEFIGW